MPYYNPVREKVLQYIRKQKLMRAGDRVAIAVSGGADSVALLRVLLELRDELGIVVAVAHFNHGLRGTESDADQAFVAELARQLELEFFVGVGDVRDHAVLNKLSVEAAGRELRYAWFARLASAKRLDAIATAHTLDDQAETVLLKFLRGAGTRGLAGIWPVVGSGCAGAEAPRFNTGVNGTPEGVPLQDGGPRLEAAGGAVKAVPLQTSRFQVSGASGEGARLRERFVSGHEFTRADNRPFYDEPASAGGTQRGTGRVVRPLLCVTRDEVEAYLESLGQSWREDASNLDRRFLRNRVRHELLPLLEREYNPNIRQALSDVAKIARGEEEYWENEVEREMKARTRANGISLARLSELPLALQRRLLKCFAEDHGVTLDFDQVEKLRRCALGEVARTELPGGLIAVNAKQWLELRSCAQDDAIEYEILLPIPGEVHIAQLGLTLRATIVPEEFGQEMPPGELLSRELIGAELTIRNWRPGDRFWPAHSGSEEKLKRLFAEKKIPVDERPTWPVALCGTEIVWVRGLAVAKACCWFGNGEGVRIEAVRVQ